ncbi:hypothetical protein ACJRO7_016084 [Eucalyptus globulus]|uniref:TIR domain-containing protein n=1 Tax=Eucalyptus globulus TaxID=34317 RepID=A0ABD3L5W8_EUCGL
MEGDGLSDPESLAQTLHTGASIHRVPGDAGYPDEGEVSPSSFDEGTFVSFQSATTPMPWDDLDINKVLLSSFDDDHARMAAFMDDKEVRKAEEMIMPANFGAVVGESGRPYRYDVFLSFRGVDTRNGFASHLHAALDQRGIAGFMDEEELWKGEEIAPAILGAMGESRISIVVDPSDVRKQRRRYGQALIDHEERLKSNSWNPEKVKRWREALSKAANISGWHLDGEEDDYAKATYNAFAQKFEHCSFLSNVRETHEKFAEDGLVQLQEAFISQVMWDDSLRLSNVHRGMSMTKTRLWEKKFLIVLDDVNQLIQLETLVGGCDWFGWVVEVNIITTRDKHLLAAHGIESMYRVQPLGRLLARRLLDSIVFQNFPPPPGYGMILHNKVDYTKGLPLAVKILCSFLRGRSLVEWKSTLDKLERVFNGEIFNVLRISFDGLDDYEKDIFLDIACLFKGESRSKVIEILESCDLYPNNGIAILIDKSLVTIEHGKLEMHDMIQEMGREIVRRESPKEPGERSRLWFHEDMLHVLAEGTVIN